MFFRYASVGLINTLIHGSVFAVAFYGAGATQAVGSVSGFCVAVTFSFFVNARFTFGADATTARYVLYVTFMGALSYVFGSIGDTWQLPPIVTLLMQAAFSLVCGFLYARFIVFKGLEKSRT